MVEMDYEQIDVVAKAGDQINWCFSSLDKDIDFQVEFVTKDRFVQPVVPLCHVQSKESLIMGQWIATSDGTVRLVFDNTKSSWYSCSVSYEISINPSDKQE